MKYKGKGLHVGFSVPAYDHLVAFNILHNFIQLLCCFTLILTFANTQKLQFLETAVQPLDITG